VKVAHALAAFCLVGVLAVDGNAQRRTSPEAQVFRQFRNGVATVYNDRGHGSGFLVDSLGLLLTNDHVAGGSSRITVKFDDSTRVEADLIASDPKADVAVIRVNPSVAARYPKLALATPVTAWSLKGIASSRSEAL
jgi:S1-C subfamily serine protease